MQQRRRQRLIKPSLPGCGEQRGRWWCRQNTAPPPPPIPHRVVLTPTRLTNLISDNNNNTTLGFTTIDPDAAELVLAMASDAVVFGRVKQVEIVVHCLVGEEESPEQEEEEDEVMRVAVRNTFRDLARRAEAELRRDSRDIWQGVGRSVVALVVVGGGALTPLAIYYHRDSNQYWALLVSQLLVVVIWVLIWHPVESLLYDRIPLRNRLKVCRRLDTAVVRVCRASKTGAECDCLTALFEQEEGEEGATPAPAAATNHKSSMSIQMA